MRCGKIDIAAIARDRDQLWAESRYRYERGETWWLDTPELNVLAANAQEERFEPGTWDDEILEWIEKPFRNPQIEVCPDFVSKSIRVTITDILIHLIGKPVRDFRQSDQNAVARCLIHAGWIRKRNPKPPRRWFYIRPGVGDPWQ